jgi:hypothetical protein
MLAMPTWGFSMSASVRPVAKSIAREPTCARA